MRVPHGHLQVAGVYVGGTAATLVLMYFGLVVMFLLKFPMDGLLRPELLAGICWLTLAALSLISAYSIARLLGDLWNRAGTGRWPAAHRLLGYIALAGAFPAVLGMLILGHALPSLTEGDGSPDLFTVALHVLAGSALFAPALCALGARRRVRGLMVASDGDAESDPLPVGLPRAP